MNLGIRNLTTELTAFQIADLRFKALEFVSVNFEVGDEENALRSADMICDFLFAGKLPEKSE